MKFVLIYPNSDKVRSHIIGWINHVTSQGVDLSNQVINQANFQIRPSWPAVRELIQFPLEMQCEEVEWSSPELTCRRKLVIDVESYVVEVGQLYLNI
jgi:hypothetical protein